MRTYFLWRVLSVFPVMLVVATVLFIILHLTPGDPARVMLGEQATEERVVELRRQLGLDQPLIVQLLQWYGRVLQLDLGDSLYAQEPVIRQIARHWEPTATLTILAVVMATGIGVPIGVFAATRQKSYQDQASMAAAAVCISVPSFWLGINLIVLFAIVLPWFPSQGFEPVSKGPLVSLRYLALPVVALGLPQVALIARMTRSCMLEVLSADFVRTARAKGLAERSVVYHHGLWNAIIPILTVIGLSFAIHLGGSVVVEQVFNIPGLGRLVVGAIQRRDYPVVQGTVLIIAAVYVLINLCVDLLYLLLDPRVKYT